MNKQEKLYATQILCRSKIAKILSFRYNQIHLFIPGGWIYGWMDLWMDNKNLKMNKLKLNKYLNVDYPYCPHV